jgi:hypothetical protein
VAAVPKHQPTDHTTRCSKGVAQGRQDKQGWHGGTHSSATPAQQGWAPGKDAPGCQRWCCIHTTSKTVPCWAPLPPTATPVAGHAAHPPPLSAEHSTAHPPTPCPPPQAQLTMHWRPARLQQRRRQQQTNPFLTHSQEPFGSARGSPSRPLVCVGPSPAAPCCFGPQPRMEPTRQGADRCPGAAAATWGGQLSCVTSLPAG